jgi:hypothetical protein
MRFTVRKKGEIFHCVIGEISVTAKIGQFFHRKIGLSGEILGLRLTLLPSGKGF